MTLNIFNSIHLSFSFLPLWSTVWLIHPLLQYTCTMSCKTNKRMYAADVVSVFVSFYRYCYVYASSLLLSWCLFFVSWMFNMFMCVSVWKRKRENGGVCFSWKHQPKFHSHKFRDAITMIVITLWSCKWCHVMSCRVEWMCLRSSHACVS